MNIFQQSIVPMKQMLTNMLGWLDLAAKQAEAKKFDIDTLCTARIAPDMYPFTKQVQAACDTAKFTAARLSGKEAPVHPDTETTMMQLRERINKVLSYLETVKEADFATAEDRMVAVAWMPGHAVKGSNYLTQLQLPNFYFHAMAAYAILRHNGVEVGKQQFIGHVDFVKM
jgi:uncharacterized protein